MVRSGAGAVRRLADHPNLGEVLGVLAQLVHVADADVPRLASVFRDDPAATAARDRALQPDSPLVCEVLCAFEAAAALFHDDLVGAPFLSTPPAIAATALRAVRDAIAGAYARPALRSDEHALLLAPWRAVYPVAAARQPDLGPEADRVHALLLALPHLAARCHDRSGQALYDELVRSSYADESDRRDARDAAFGVAVLTSRRRVWALVRRTGTEGLGRPCTTCPAGDATPHDTRRVLTVCLDAACALLVADALPDDALALLLAPVRSLVPAQRRST